MAEVDTLSDEQTLRARAAEFGQDHIFRFWDKLSAAERTNLLAQVREIDFPLMQRLAEEWIFQTPAPEKFNDIKPLSCLPVATQDNADARAAWEAGEAALRAGRVGLFLVAGGQGTRLGFEGPKGAYPIGPITGKTLFQYHAEKIANLQHRYGCVLPWYIMVSDANEAETRGFFAANNYFGLAEKDVTFLTQRMVPCMDAEGKFMLEEPGALAMNPNGHGGSLPAMVERGILDDARARGIDLLSFFQVDNWAVQVADPYFIGYHVLAQADMSSKNHRKHAPREAVGVHCICDGQYRVIEYSELDLYPQLLDTDAAGNVVYYAGNPAIHMISVDFVQRVYDHFDEFPWHLAHKKIPHLDAQGNLVKPDKPNGYKFETFVFDALRFIRNAPLGLEITPQGEYTPIKQFEGDNSVVAARQSMANHWGAWLDAAGLTVPRTEGKVSIPIEISPRFAWTKDEFLANAATLTLPSSFTQLAIDEDGNITT